MAASLLAFGWLPLPFVNPFAPFCRPASCFKMSSAMSPSMGGGKRPWMMACTLSGCLQNQSIRREPAATLVIPVRSQKLSRFSLDPGSSSTRKMTRLSITSRVDNPTPCRDFRNRGKWVIRAGKSGTDKYKTLAWFSPGGGGEPFADGELGEGREVLNLQFAHDIPAVGFDGLYGDMQQGGDVFGGFAFGEKLADFALACGEHGADFGVDAGAFVAEVIVDHGAGDFGAEVFAAAMHDHDGAANFVAGGFFEHIAGRPGLEHGGDEAAVGVGGEGAGLYFGPFGQDLAGGIDAVEAGHADIHDDHVRGGGIAGHGEGHSAVGGFA